MGDRRPIFARALLPACLALAPSLVAAQAITLVSPYRNQGRWWKGQLHAHSTRSDGRLAPREVVERYLAAGYAFVSLTDHRNIRRNWFDGPTSCEVARTNPAPDLPITVMPGLELGQPPHLAYVGFPEQGDCHPKGVRLPDDVGEFLRWIDERGGLAVAAHPMFGERRASCNRKRRWGAKRLWEHAAPRGHLKAMEIQSRADLDVWDRLLAKGRRVWGVLTDDSHRREAIDGRGFVMANAAVAGPLPGQTAILDSLRAGDFYAVRLGLRGRRLDPPAFERIDVIQDAGGPWTVRASVTGAEIYRCVYGARDATVHSICHGELSRSCVEAVVREGSPTTDELMGCMRPRCEATCPASGGLDGSEGYVRIELENVERAIAYSQPIWIERAPAASPAD